MTALQPAGSVVVVLADGEAREGGPRRGRLLRLPVLRQRHGLAARLGRPAVLPRLDAGRLGEAGGCASPACPANMSAAQKEAAE